MSEIKAVILSCTVNKHGWEGNFELLIGGGKQISFGMDVSLLELSEFEPRRILSGRLSEETMKKIGVRRWTVDVHTLVCVKQDRNGVTVCMDERVVNALAEDVQV